MRIIEVWHGAHGQTSPSHVDTELGGCGRAGMEGLSVEGLCMRLRLGIGLCIDGL